MIINAKVKTGQKHFSVVKGEIWHITTKAKAEKNKANHEIINELSKEYTSVKIIRGHSSSRKVIEVEK